MEKSKWTKFAKGKGGFTLVELVVVIAILAILAAIAIPTVVGIINNANKTSELTSAQQLDDACVSYCAGIVSGTITDSNHGNSTQADLPPEVAAYVTRVSAARNGTVQNAIDYAGLRKLIDRVNNGSFVYDADGRIYAAIDKTTLTSTVTLTTTLADLYPSL